MLRFLITRSHSHSASRYTYSRVPDYRGWWTKILEQPKTEPVASPSESNVRQPIPLPSFESPPPLPDPKPEKQIVMLGNEALEVPQKPEAPDNCCMSGCAVCVWDLYQEEIEEYQEQKAALRQRFVDAGLSVPEILSKKSISIEDDMDPTMRAFYNMEKKLGSR